MKRILIIATTPLIADGITKIELDIINYNKEIFNFEIACGFEIANLYKNFLLVNDIRLHSLPEKKKTLAYMQAIVKLVNQEKYDIIYIHGNSALMMLEAFPSKIGGAKKIITHCHNTKSNFPIIHYLLKPFFNLIVDKKLACSIYAANWAYNKKRVEIILNGIDINKYKYNLEIRKNKRDQLGWSDNFIIGHIGRFNKQKNHVKLIDIFEEIYNRNQQARLLLIGDGKLKQNIKKIVCEKKLEHVVCFRGVIDNISDYLQAMDIVLLPSLFEGLCITALEAQANGIPVVMSDKFSPETLATPSAYSIPLENSASIWATNILENISLNRRNNIEELKKANLDKPTMMKRIREVLIN